MLVGESVAKQWNLVVNYQLRRCSDGSSDDDGRSAGGEQHAGDRSVLETAHRGDQFRLKATVSVFCFGLLMEYRGRDEW